MCIHGLLLDRWRTVYYTVRHLSNNSHFPEFPLTSMRGVLYASAPPGDGCRGGHLSRVWQSLLVGGWPDFHEAGLQVYMCCPCGRVVQFGGKAIPVTQTQTSDLLITWLVVVSIKTLVARIWDTDQPVCSKLHSSDTNGFNKKINLMHAWCC